jgi:hypothetical protein
MSVSQVKKRFAEMESYLGRDKEALRRLKLLKDDVNVLRTSLAAAEEKAVEAEAVKEAARKRADEAEASLAQSHSILSRMSDELAALKAKEAIRLQAEANKNESRVVLSEDQQIVAVVAELAKAMTHSPDPLMTRRLPDRAEVIERNDVAVGWSRRSLWLLGAFVAIHAGWKGAVLICTQDRFRDRHSPGSGPKPWTMDIFNWMNKSKPNMEALAAHPEFAASVAVEVPKQAGYKNLR